MRVFNNHNLNIEVIEQVDDVDVKSYVKGIDINNITPIESLLILKRIKELLK